MIAVVLSLKSWRIAIAGFAERFVRREPASADSLGRVLPASWTDARLASAASLWGKPARAGCAPFASAERCGSPGLLNVGQGGSRIRFRRIATAFTFACILTPSGAGLDAATDAACKGFRSHSSCKCLVTVFADSCDDTLWRSRGASPGWAVARSGSRGPGGA